MRPWITNENALIKRYMLKTVNGKQGSLFKRRVLLQDDQVLKIMAHNHLSENICKW